MSASHSETQQRSNTSTANTVVTENRNVSGNSGITAVSEGGSLALQYAPVSVDDRDVYDNRVSNDNRVNISYEPEAVKLGISAATSAAALAVNASGASNEAMRSLASDAVRTNSATVQNLFAAASDIGLKIGQLEKDTTNRALMIADTTTANAQSFARETLTAFGDRLAQFQASNQTQLGNVVSALNSSLGTTVTSLNSSYRDANTSSDQRIADIAKESTDLVREVFKYGAIAAGVAVGAFLLYKGSKAFA